MTYHYRLTFSTASNKIKLSCIPGNRSVYTKKVGKAPRPPGSVCPGRLQGIPAVRTNVLKRLSKTAG
ncbi:60S ribosomal protein L34 [Lemmus lemmus]